jgi:hypothetical protein
LADANGRYLERGAGRERERVRDRPGASAPGEELPRSRWDRSADAVTRGRMNGAGRERQLRRRVEPSGSDGKLLRRPSAGRPDRAPRGTWNGLAAGRRSTSVGGRPARVWQKRRGAGAGPSSFGEEARRPGARAAKAVTSPDGRKRMRPDDRGTGRGSGPGAWSTGSLSRGDPPPAPGRVNSIWSHLDRRHPGRCGPRAAGDGADARGAGRTNPMGVSG